MLDRSAEPSSLTPAHSAAENLAPDILLRATGPYAAPLFPTDTTAVFARLLKILRKQRWVLFAFIASGMLLALAFQLTCPRLYSATALLRLDRHSAPGAVGQEASQISGINDMDVTIDTDMEVAQSDPVVRPVAEKYGLAGYGKTSSVWGRLLKRGNDAESIRRAKAAPVELSGLKVTRPANTYLIRITYRAWKNPQLASDVANGIAESLVRQVHESLDLSYVDLSRSMREDRRQLRLKMEASSQKLAQYERKLNMIDPEQRTTVLTKRLTELLSEYTVAQADRFSKEATFEGISKSPTLAATRAAESEHQRQSLLDEALQHLSSARQQFVAARSYYGENHPEYRKAKQQLEEAEAQVEAMRVATNERTEANYRQALDRELLIKRQFEQTKAEIDALKGNSLAYSELKTEAENDRRIYLELESRMRDADVNRQFRDATIQFVAPALPPAAAIFPKLTVNLPVAFVLALVMGVLGAIAAEALDNTFSDAEELTARVRLEVMATLPDVRPLRKHGALTSTFHTVYSRSLEMGARYEESIRMLRNAIGRMRTQQAMDEPPRTLLITSGNAGEGKSTTAARLAEACARGGKKVLLIDADLWRPSVLKKFDVYSKLGLADVLANGISPADVIVEVIPGLFIMPAGPALMNPADLIGLSFSNVLSQVKSHFDLVIIDAPPLLGPSETQEIATMVDSVLVIVRAHATSAKHLAETLKTLSRSRANVAGIVLNRVKVANLRGFANYYDPAAASEHFRGAGVTG